MKRKRLLKETTLSLEKMSLQQVMNTVQRTDVYTYIRYGHVLSNIRTSQKLHFFLRNPVNRLWFWYSWHSKTTTLKERIFSRVYSRIIGKKEICRLSTPVIEKREVKGKNNTSYELWVCTNLYFVVNSRYSWIIRCAKKWREMKCER